MLARVIEVSEQKTGASCRQASVISGPDSQKKNGPVTPDRVSLQSIEREKYITRRLRVVR
jgi:hypothetical protein